MFIFTRIVAWWPLSVVAFFYRCVSNGEVSYRCLVVAEFFTGERVFTGVTQSQFVAFVATLCSEEAFVELCL